MCINFKEVLKMMMTYLTHKNNIKDLRTSEEFNLNLRQNNVLSLYILSLNCKLKFKDPKSYSTSSFGKKNLFLS